MAKAGEDHGRGAWSGADSMRADRVTAFGLEPMDGYRFAKKNADQIWGRASDSSETERSAQEPRRAIRAVRVYVEVHDLDAALWLGMAGTGSPGPVAELSRADLCKPEAAPFAARRETRFTLAAELIGEHLLLLLRMAEDDGTEFAGITPIHTGDWLAPSHGLFKQAVIGTWHRLLPFGQGTYA